MTPETLKALKGSIAKWKRIVAGRGVDRGSENCPLCKLFNNEANREYYYGLKTSCDGCPVMDKTGYRFCGGSPYIEWTETQPVNGRIHTRAQHRTAQAELEFLQSLLPVKS